MKRFSRVLKRVLVALVALELIYVIAANVFLSGRILGHFTNQDPVAMNIQYRHAWTILPGFVHVDDLTIRGRNDDTEWLVAIDEANLRIRLLELARKHFSATHVRVNKVSVRLRFRFEQKDIESEPVAALPDIFGFPNPPLQGPEPRHPRPDEDHDQAWTVRLDDVVVEHAREVWVHAIKYSGDARVAGRWVFEPGRSLEIGPLHAEFGALEVAYGTAPFVTDAHGVLDGEIARFDLREHGDPSMVAFLSTTADLRGTVRMSLGLSSLVGIDGLQIVNGQGPAHVTANIRSGVLRPGTHIDTKQTGVELGYSLLSLTHDLQFTFDVAADEHGVDTGRGAAVGSAVQLSRRNAKASIGEAKFTVEGRKLTLHEKPFADALFGFEGREVRADDLASWTDGDVHTEGIRLEGATATWSLPDAKGRVDAKADLGRIFGGSGGSAEASTYDLHSLVIAGGADVDSKEGVVRAKGFAKVKGAHLTLGSSTVDTQVDVNVVAPEILWRRNMVDLSGSSVTLGNATLSSARKRIIQAKVATAIAKSLHLGGGGATGQISFSIPRGVVPDASALGPMLSLPKGVSVRHGVGAFALDANLDVASRSAEGELTFRIPDLAVGLGERTIAGDFQLAVHARREHGNTRFDASRLTFQERTTNESEPWWMETWALPCTLSWNDGPRFSGAFQGDARDASPAQVLVGEETSIPGWVATAITIPNLHYGAELALDKKRLALTQAYVNGDEASLRANYIEDHGKKSGKVTLHIAGAPLTFDLGN